MNLEPDDDRVERLCVPFLWELVPIASRMKRLCRTCYGTAITPQARLRYAGAPR